MIDETKLKIILARLDRWCQEPGGDETEEFIEMVSDIRTELATMLGLPVGARARNVEQLNAEDPGEEA
jgi:hypothetical protein